MKNREYEEHLIDIAQDDMARLVSITEQFRQLMDSVKKHASNTQAAFEEGYTFASMAVASGFSLPVIGGLLGHTQPSTTARYAHLQNDLLKDAAGKVGDAIQKAMSENKDKS